MTRKELMMYFHNKVIMENNPYKNPNEELDFEFAVEYPPQGPFDNTLEDPFNDETTWTPVDRRYGIGFNYAVLSLDEPPVKLVWGISDSWLFEVEIPLGATRLDECSWTGSSGE